jgi:energy-coupling factor transport system ATP-binding protein
VQHLNGLLKPTEGTVLFKNEDIWKNPKEIRKIRSKVGLVFQYPEYQLFEETVYADIAFGPKNMGLSGAELDSCVNDICKIIGIKDEYLKKSPFDLSGGEKRRVAIAGVMAMKPDVIIFDEPTAGLDPRGREEVMEIISNYRKATGATVVIISHSMEDMAALADRIIVMNGGKLEMFDTVENVFTNGERLREMGLNVPIITRVFDLLRKQGITVPKNVFTVEQAVEALKALREGNYNA